MRTKLGTCLKKARFQTEQDALAAARTATIPLRHYRCDRCRQYHLTSRTKGKRAPAPDNRVSRGPALQVCNSPIPFVSSEVETPLTASLDFS